MVNKSMYENRARNPEAEQSGPTVGHAEHTSRVSRSYPISFQKQNKMKQMVFVAPCSRSYRDLNKKFV
jgi:hypothetical protein